MLDRQPEIRLQANLHGVPPLGGAFTLDDFLPPIATA
jgi:hypothetical protein